MATIQTLNGAEKIKDSYGKINTSLTNLNNDKLEKSGDTMTGLLTALGGIDLEVSSVPTGKVGRMYANGDTKKIYYHDGTDWREVWHSGNNPANIAQRGYQKFASGLILQWGHDTITGGSTTFTLPIAYPMAHLVTIPVAESSDPNLNVTTGNFITTQFTAWVNDTNPVPIRWISVGV